MLNMKKTKLIFVMITANYNLCHPRITCNLSIRTDHVSYSQLSVCINQPVVSTALDGNLGWFLFRYGKVAR